ncbi:MAG: GNAT family N-acetyltransferase [Salinivirgaceae bacterium]|nr:GNAT family N-acetyltransferase [Salinivirgaceae bacterium]
MKLLVKNNSVQLRGLEPEDLEFLYECENNPEIWNVSNTLAPYSKYILRQYIENSHHDIYTNKQLRLIISDTEKPEVAVGAIDLFDFDPYHLRAGVGILVHDEANRRKGYAKEALKVLIKYCFKHLHLHQLYCNIAIDNCQSISLFEKAGFVKCGEKTEWIKTDEEYKTELMFQLVNKN